MNRRESAALDHHITGNYGEDQHASARAEPKHEYRVYYGNNLSWQTCPNWKEAAAFIKHCLDTGTIVKGVVKQRVDLRGKHP